MNNNVDDYINEIASKVKKELNIFQRIFLKVTQQSILHHWGIGLYIRNNYIYNNESLMKFNIEPDELSEQIIKKIVK